jgi:predicted MFS family arabinose efflux permease
MVTSSTFDWREQWFLFTGLAGILLIPALTWLPPPDSSKATQAGAPMVDRPPSPMLMRLLLAAYFCAGIGYVVSATFTVAIIDRLPGLSGSGNLAFLVIGLAAAPACIVWDLVARRIGEINALILAAGLQTIGIVLPVFIYELWAAILSAMIFGGTFIGMVSLVLTMAGKFYPTKPAKMMGQMTLAYGSAQILGPAVTGWIGAVSGSYAYGLLFAATVMVLGVILLSVIHHRRLH